jgi:hypothetical protein
LESQNHGAGWSGSLFCQDDVGFAGSRVVFLAQIFAVEQNYYVGVLL